MMKTHRWLWMLAALAVPAGYGCVDDEAGPTVITERGAIQVNMDFPLANLPGGVSEVTEPPVLDLDTITYPTDLFGRGAPSRDPVFIQSGDLDIDYTTDWIAIRFRDDDKRLPALIAHDLAGASLTGMADWIEFDSPDGASTFDRWDYRSDIDRVGSPNGWYAVGLARYGVKVNGLVDHLEALVNNGLVLEPDSLVLLGGAPGGYPDHRADYWTSSGDDCPPVPPDANPFVMAHFKVGPLYDPKDTGADGDGETDADLCFMGNGLWQAAYDAPLHPDSIPFAPNNFESFDLPQYNYLLTWEFDPATNTVFFDKPHMRAQVGIELDLDGNPIPHAFAPLPTAPGRELSDYDSYEEFLLDPVVTAGVTDLRLTLYNLKDLAAGFIYQIWLVGEGDVTPTRISAVYTLQRPDTVGEDELGLPIIEWLNVSDPQTVDAFDGAVGLRHVIELSNENLGGGVVLGDFTDVAITIGDSDASPLESATPACYQYQNPNGVPTNLPAVGFAAGGEFSSFCNYSTDRSWAGFGTGLAQFLYNPTGGAQGADAGGISLGLNRLALPPLGYYYAVWVEDAETGDYTALGEITSPPPGFVSFFDADLGPDATTDAWLTEGEIFTAVKWMPWNELPSQFMRCITSQVTDPCHLRVTLEPKNGDHDVKSDVTIFIGDIPKDLDKLPKEKESG